MSELAATAKALVAQGKGILAADESEGTIAKRLAAVGVESTEEHRRAYRDLLFTTAGAADFISGVILYDETIAQQSADGTPFPELLERQGIIPGIKVDKGANPLALCPGETVTEGLDGLRARFEEYRSLGARFAKWRAVITIGPGIPTETCLSVNAHALARYAALAQEAGLDAHVAVADDYDLVAGLADHAAELVDLVACAARVRANEQADRAPREIGDQFPYDRNRRLLVIGDAEQDFEFGIILAAEAGEVLVGFAIQTANRFQNADGRSEIGGGGAVKELACSDDCKKVIGEGRNG